MFHMVGVEYVSIGRSVIVRLCVVAKSLQLYDKQPKPFAVQRRKLPAKAPKPQKPAKTIVARTPDFAALLAKEAFATAKCSRR
jgi:hypothetical protein